MSALVRIPDSSRISHEVRKAPNKRLLPLPPPCSTDVAYLSSGYSFSVNDIAAIENNYAVRLHLIQWPGGIS
jgi:hypothetical protein